MEIVVRAISTQGTHDLIGVLNEIADAIAGGFEEGKIKREDVSAKWHLNPVNETEV